MATLSHLLDNSARRFGDKSALQITRGYRTDEWSYRFLYEASERIASHLKRLGIRRGDRVLALAPNMPEWVGLFFGCLRAGVVIVPLDIRSSPDFMAKVQQQTEARLLFISKLLERQSPDLGVPIHYLEDLREHIQDADVESGLPYPDEDDIAEIMFTSGTTGDPKGVILTHGNIMSNVVAANSVVPSRSRYRVLSLLPLSHMLEQTVGLLTPMIGGAAVVYASSLQPSAIFRTLQEERISTMVVVPQVLQLFWQGIEREVDKQGKRQTWQRMLNIAAYLPMRLRRIVFRSVHTRLGRSLQFITTGGAYLDPELARNWELLGVPIIQGYGTTEASPIITASSLKTRRPDSVGKVLPGQNIKFAEDGEILLKGPNVTQGYWRNPEATDAAFDGEWYRTGDIGEMDEQGFLRLHGRKKDMIVLENGMNVYPQDVEEALKAHPDVSDAAVLDLPRKDGKVSVHAILLLSDPDADPKAIVSQTNAGLAAHQRIRDFTVWPFEDFPRTHTLKIKKPEVRDYLLEQAQPGAPEPSAQVVRKLDDVPELYRLVEDVTELRVEDIRPSATLDEDLELDSLRIVELLSLIEDELGVYVDESQICAAMTVGDLENLLAQSGGQSNKPEFWNWPLNRVVRLIGTVIQSLVAFPLLRLIMPQKVSGRANLEMVKGPVIFAANHLSHLDTPAVVSALPLRCRMRIAIAAAADVWFDQGRSAAATSALLFNAFPFSRTGSIRPTLKHTSNLLGKGWSILIYPEGTRSNDGKMGRFKSGTGLMAVEMGVPVVPVHIQGTFEVLSKDERWPRRHRVSVRFGKPLHFAPDMPYAEATRVIESAVWSLGHAEKEPNYALENSTDR